jgi:acetylornithine deacetylase/succinyl-diaminopimelate desuccinylase-like protein
MRDDHFKPDALDAPRPTPETDARRKRNGNVLCGEANLDLCARLERERDEAREHAELWRTWERETGTKRDHALKLYLETVSERDRLEAAVRTVMEEVGNDYLGCKDELREALNSLNKP